MRWAGALRMGMGGRLAGGIANLPGGGRQILRALDMAAASLAEGGGIPDEAAALFAKPLVPRCLYTLFGNAERGLPSFKSEAFPYGGYYYLRGGWDYDKDQYALFFCSSHPGNAPFRSDCNNNSFFLVPYGPEILVPGGMGVFARTVMAFPRVYLRLYPMLRKTGTKNIQKRRKEKTARG